MAIQVVNAVSNTAWTTDKVEISTTVANVTFQVSVEFVLNVQSIADTVQPETDRLLGKL